MDDQVAAGPKAGGGSSGKAARNRGIEASLAGHWEARDPAVGAPDFRWSLTNNRQAACRRCGFRAAVGVFYRYHAGAFCRMHQGVSDQDAVDPALLFKATGLPSDWRDLWVPPVTTPLLVKARSLGDQSSPRVAGLLALAARVARATRGRSGWLEAAYPGPGQRG